MKISIFPVASLEFHHEGRVPFPFGFLIVVPGDLVSIAVVATLMARAALIFVDVVYVFRE